MSSAAVVIGILRINRLLSAGEGQWIAFIFFLTLPENKSLAFCFSCLLQIKMLYISEKYSKRSKNLLFLINIKSKGCNFAKGGHLQRR